MEISVCMGGGKIIHSFSCRLCISAWQEKQLKVKVLNKLDLMAHNRKHGQLTFGFWITQFKNTVYQEEGEILLKMWQLNTIYWKHCFVVNRSCTKYITSQFFLHLFVLFRHIRYYYLSHEKRETEREGRGHQNDSIPAASAASDVGCRSSHAITSLASKYSLVVSLVPTKNKSSKRKQVVSLYGLAVFGSKNILLGLQYSFICNKYKYI